MHPDVRHMTNIADPRRRKALDDTANAALHAGRARPASTWLAALALRLTARSRRPLPEGDELASALTALRSSAEALRDYPDAHRDARLRLVDIVLSEEARLERLLIRRREGAEAA